MSHPSWVCGLKLTCILFILIALSSHPSWVCGLKQRIPLDNMRHLWSHPSWVCGLKLVRVSYYTIWCCHTLRGCVDWNFRYWVNPLPSPVTPFVGVWIETFAMAVDVGRFWCHTLRGCVDWNRIVTTLILLLRCHTLRGCVDWNCTIVWGWNGWWCVTPFVGVWIETHIIII